MRFILGVPIAAVITLGLFLMMKSFIEGDEYQKPEEVAAGPEIDFRLDQHETIEPESRKPEKSPPPEKIPEPKVPDETYGPVGGDPGPTIPVPGGGEGPSLPEPDTGGAIALIKVPPQYPACGRNREGWVLLEFDVSPTGQPVNIVVLDADPPGKCFSKAAIAAVKKWKYRAAMRDGQPVAQPGQQVVISFELED